MKNTLKGLIVKLDTAMERISEFEDASIETSQTEMQTEKENGKLEQNIKELWGPITKKLIYA